jgi:cysteine desulfurase
MAREIYLDNSATTRVFPETADYMRRICLEAYGNPSSMHHKGVEAEKILSEAARTLAGLLKVKPANLVFTSCGTESDNTAIIGGALAARRRGTHLVTTRIEHPAVLESMRFLEKQGFTVTYLPVDRDGIVSPESVYEAVRPDTVLVSVMHTNNEIGSLQPLAEIGRAVKDKNPAALFHTDAVQGFGKDRIFPRQLGVDLLSASGHKIHAPKGIGLLYIADKVRIQPMVLGGGQQRGLRSGTDNVAGAAAMAMSAGRLYQNFDEDIRALRAMKAVFIEEVLKIPEVRINGRTGEDSAPHIISVTVPGVRAEVLLHALEDRGVYLSAGSACASNRPHVSETLKAIGLSSDGTGSTLRVSLSVMNTEEDVREAAAAMADLIPFLRRYTRR